MNKETIIFGARSYGKTYDEYWNRITKLQQENKQLKENYERIYNENCKLRENHNINDISLLDENEQLKEELKNKPDTKWTLTTKDGKELTIIQSERIDMQEELNKTITKLFNQLKNKDGILTELEEWLNKIIKITANLDEKGTCKNVLDKIQELKEKYK